jgi:hypothetical protein
VRGLDRQLSWQPDEERIALAFGGESNSDRSHFAAARIANDAAAERVPQELVAETDAENRDPRTNGAA